MSGIAILVAVVGLLYAARSLAPAEGATVATTTLAFGFVLLVSHLAGRAVERLHVPKVTGYLVIGILVGPHALGLVTADMTASLRLIDGVAVCLIALTAGGELNFQRIRPLLRLIVSVLGWSVLGTAVLLAAAVFLMRPFLPFLSELEPMAALAVSGVLGLTLASQSPAVVQALLNETHSDGPLSRTVLALVVISDLVIIVLYALASAGAGSLLGAGHALSEVVLSVAWELLGSVAIGLGVGLVLYLFVDKVERGSALFVLVVCVATEELGRRAHLDPLIVMLTAGVFLENATPVNATKLIHEIEGASLPIYVIFFAVAGAVLDLGVLAAVAVPAGLLALLRAAGFWGGGVIAARRSRAPAQVGKLAWIGLLPQAGLALVLALLFERTLPGVGPGAAALVVGVVAINQIVTPFFLRLALVKAGEVGHAEAHDFGEDAGDEAQGRASDPAPALASDEAPSP